MSSISLIIPTYNNDSTLRACLESIKKQSLVPNEIIIADGHSTDDSINIAKEYDCKIVYEDRGTRAAACNEALKIAQGDIIVFTDSDIVADKEWLKNLSETFNKMDHEVACVAGPHLEYPDESLFGKAVSAIYDTIFGGRWSEQVKSIFDKEERFVQSAAGCNAAYRREAIEEVLPFNESLLTAEDTDINYRLIQKGKKLFFTPSAIIYHQRPQRHKTFRNKSKKYAIGKIQFFRTHKVGLELWHLLPVLYFLTGLFLSIVLFVNLWIGVGVAVYFGLYIIAIQIASIVQTIKYRQWQFLFMLPLMFIEGHIFWSLGILQEIFASKKKRD
ncbi:MAG: glycosyltransferase [Candidatus Heimdallarchaeota archaeon]|nr:MAG: glycosyltransferase [Candidatus Heimdallarchaeota archaeon]